MKIGDEVYVHGYVDEIRYDDTKRVSTIIIRNDGGYFGTVPSEIDRKTENSSEIPNKCEDEFFREPTAEERKAVADYIDSISVPTGVNVFDLMDEPQTDCPTSCPFKDICTKDDTDCPWK